MKGKPSLMIRGSRSSFMKANAISTARHGKLRLQRYEEELLGKILRPERCTGATRKLTVASLKGFGKNSEL